VLVHIFELPFDRAEQIMLTAHYSGVAYVASYPRAEAERRAREAHQRARQAGYPLTFTIEPET